MTKEEALQFGKMWLEMNEDCADSKTYQFFKLAINVLEQAQDWIPISEGLPKEGERVLATHLGGLNPNKQVIEHIYQCGKFTCGWDMDMDMNSPTFGQRYMGKVIAWMPFSPKPYEPESKDDE